jgi:uncharacterized membrane protein required for colicin V production
VIVVLSAQAGAGPGWVDGVALGITGFCFLRGCIRGLLLQFLGLCFLSAGAALAFGLSPRFGAFIRAEVWEALTDRVARATAFVVLLAAAIGVSTMLLRLIGDSSRTLRGGWLNRLTGGVLGAVKGVLLLMAAILAMASVLHREGAEPPRVLRDIGISRTGAATRWTAFRIGDLLPEEVAEGFGRYTRKLP